MARKNSNSSDAPSKKLGGKVGKTVGKPKMGPSPAKGLKGPVGKEVSTPPWIKKKSK